MVRLTNRGHYFVITVLMAPIGFGLGINSSKADTSVPVPIVAEIKETKVEALTVPRIKVESGTTPESAKILTKQMVKANGWSVRQWKCLRWIWGKEAAFRYDAVSPTNDYGIPQRNMPTASRAEREDFLSSPRKQIEWGLNYIEHRYGTPCEAKSFWERNRWY